MIWYSFKSASKISTSGDLVFLLLLLAFHVLLRGAGCPGPDETMMTLRLAFSSLVDSTLMTECIVGIYVLALQGLREDDLIHLDIVVEMVQTKFFL